MNVIASVHGVVEYGPERLPYSARFAKRSTMAISVHPDGSIEIIAPSGTSPSEIGRRLRKRAAWVCRQLRYFEQFIPRTTPRQFVNGETHLYLGKQYRLRVRQGHPEGVRLVGGRLEIAVQDRHDGARIRKLLTAWYREKAEVWFDRRFVANLARFRFSKAHRPHFKIRAMTRRWGSHGVGGAIILNPHLIRASVPCIDYVITHELCHILQPHHKPAFFRLLDRQMPDWRNRKARLESLLA